MKPVRYLFFAVFALVGLSLCGLACRQSTSYNASTPTAALETVRNAKRDHDAETFKKILSSQTIQFLQSEAARTSKPVSEFLKEYFERQDQAGTPEPPEREAKIDDNTVELFNKNNRMLGRFVKEGDEWKMDGLGWPMKKTSA
jgi:hypothetical protein